MLYEDGKLQRGIGGEVTTETARNEVEGRSGEEKGLLHEILIFSLGYLEGVPNGGVHSR